MMLTDAIEIKKPDPDSHFRLLPCKRCRSEDAAYVRYQSGGAKLWRVQCLGCGHFVDKGTEIMHDAQIVWNREVVA